MVTRKDLTRQIKNARRRLGRLKARRSRGPEAKEALEGGPLEADFTKFLDGKIKGEEELITKLGRERSQKVV